MRYEGLKWQWADRRFIPEQFHEAKDWVGSLRIPLVIVTALLCLSWVGISAYATWSAYVNFPVGDEWADVGLTPSFQELFAFENEHRIAVSKVLFLIDQNAFEGRGIFNLVCVFVIQFVACLLFSTQIWKSNFLSDIEKSVLTLLSFVLSFWSYNYENLTWGFQHVWPAVLCFSFSAFAIFVRDPKRARNVALALLCVTFATFSFSNGILSGFVLVVLAVMMRARILTIAIIATFTMALLKVYLWGYPGRDPLEALQHAESVVTYSLAFFGGPLRFALPGLEPAEASVWCGTAVACLSLYAITHCFRRRADLDRSTLFAFAIVLFVGATGVLIAIGRFDFVIRNTWSSRYGNGVVQLYPALLTIMTPLMRWSRVRWFPTALVIAMIGYAVGTQPRFLRDATYWTDMRKRALTATVVGVGDEEEMFSPFSLELLQKQVATLRVRHQSIYVEDWPFWIGRSLAGSSVTLVPPSQCEGLFEEMTPVANGARVRGWVWDRVLKRTPRIIIFADEQDRIIGVALSGYARDDVTASRPEIDGQEIGWLGHVTGLYGSRTVRALALGSDHRSACEFGAVPVSPAAAPPVSDGSPDAGGSRE